MRVNAYVYVRVCAVGQRCPVEVYNYISVTPFLLNLPNNEAGVETGEKGDSEDHALKH